MRNCASRTRVCLSIFTILLASTFCDGKPALPNPILIFTGMELMTVNGVVTARYHFDVFNKGDYPAEMFAASPGLPPCGNNTKASRTWLDIYDQNGKRLNGFCALGKSDDLGKIWFSLPIDAVPPSWIYIELNDRQTNTKYKSNLADTVM